VYWKIKREWSMVKRKEAVSKVVARICGGVTTEACPPAGRQSIW